MMKIEYNIINKNSIHISFDKSGAKSLIATLSELISALSVLIPFDTVKNYRGKVLDGLKFVIVEEGEYVFFKEGILFFEIEKEMAEEFVLFIENAIKNGGFKTPEIISFSPKSKKDVEIMIYGFLNE